MTESRALHLLGATGKVRTEMIGTKEHLVVPVVMLMEGVIHAVNAETPEFVPFETLEKAAASWNGKPVTLGHPKRDGKQCSASETGIWDAHGIGVIRNARVDAASKKMLGEALIETSRAKKLHPDMYQRLVAGETEEVSIGALVVSNHKSGKHTNGKPYIGTWTMAQGDHLAFLPGGRGACSVAMGCGTHRAAMRVCEMAFELEILGALPDKAQVGGAMKVGDKVKVNKPGHDAHGKSGIITAMKEGMHTVGDHGSFSKSELRAAQAGDSTEEEAELIAYQSMRTILDGVSGQYDEISKLVDALIADETENPAETEEDEAAEEQIETARLDAIRALCNTMASALQSVASATYCQSLSDSPRYMTALAGARHSAKDTGIIQTVHDHMMTLGATCDRGNYKLMERNIKEDEIKIKSSNLNDPTRRYIEKVKAGAQ